MKYEQSYAHDLVGARLRGAARRTSEHAIAALEAAKYWSHHREGNDAYGCLRAVIRELMGAAYHGGASKEEITLAFKSAVWDLTGEQQTRVGVPEDSRHVCLSTDRTDSPRGLDRWKPPEGVRWDDPSNELTWEKYDAQVDKLREDDLRDALKREARLRRDALNELADIRGEGEIKSERNIDGRD